MEVAATKYGTTREIEGSTRATVRGQEAVPVSKFSSIFLDFEKNACYEGTCLSRFGYALS